MQKDVIYRQEAIDGMRKLQRWNVVRGYNKNEGFLYDDVMYLLDKLPSAQTERKVFEEMSDAEFEKWLHEHGICNPDIHDSIPCGVVPALIDDAINELPAQTERKKGKWQITDAYPHNVYCSKCHTRFAQTHWAVWEDGSLPRNFCPSCGADMRGENE